jgi:hypothetical protein
VSDPAALPLPGRVPRAHGHPPPLRVWIAAAALFAIIAALAALAFEIATPMPTQADTRFFEHQLMSLQKQAQAYRAQGADPISIVFLGTSRMKNVAMNARTVAAEAKAAGVQRPVASTYFAIDWGGFERLSPEIAMVEQARPDVVVLMPDFFFQDFNSLARLRFGLHFLQARLWGKDFLFFGEEEYERPACVGFDVSTRQRHALNDRWLAVDTDSRGPMLARRATQALAANGITVIVADVPTTPSLSGDPTRFSGAAFAAQSGLELSPNIRTAWIGQAFDKDDYCDLAHIRPDRAFKWQRAFFARSAGVLNGLR